jgi:hypothetical protein
MDELIGRIVANVGVNRPVADTAVGIILEFLAREAPPEIVQALIDRLPGAQTAIETTRQGAGLPFGGVMGVGMRLMGAGLTMDQIKGINGEIMAFARENAGDEVVDRFIRAVPGLNQFI